jgi:predicted AlkP superfamily phosphohydrolase/phosphomutase
MPRRVLLVALDGLDISILRKAMGLGRVPNLAAFCDGALEAEVHSDGEVIEGSVWPTFASGTGPGTHGHNWFMQWLAEEGRFVPASHPALAFDPFWKAALEAGKRTLVFDLPYITQVGNPLERTYTGWGVQDEMAEHAHPASFRKEVLRRHGRSLTRKDTMLERTPEDRLRLARRSKASARQRAEVLVDFAARRDWDFMVFGFGEYHRAGHHLALAMQLSPTVTSEQAMMSLLQPLDQAWPRVVAAAGVDCDIALFALHGMLGRVAYGATVQGILNHMAGKPPAPPAAPDLLRRLRDLIPEAVHESLWLRMPAGFRMSRVANGWLAGMDLERDPVLKFEGDGAVALRLNLAGREPHGVVPAGEGRAVAERVWGEARRYRTDDGRPAFASIEWTADRFAGPRVHRLPDFTITYAPGVERARALVRDDGFTIPNTAQESRTGAHTSIGFCFVRPADGAALRRTQIRTEDFAPTALERVGVTPPSHLEGDVFLG